MIVDTHCHLHFPELISDLKLVLANMQAANVQAAIAVCTKLDEAELLRDLTNDHAPIYASIGVHPNADATELCDKEKLVKLLSSHPKFIAVGEAGLDYYWDGRQARAHQLPRLETQIEVALQTNLPLIVHTRDSIDDTLDVLSAPCKEGLRVVLHCFTGTWSQATRALDLGCLLSFTGIITFKNARDLLEVAVRMPLESLMLETDAPYLAPVPVRGKRNEPAFVDHTIAHLAKKRNLPYTQFCATTTATACRFFALQP